MKLSVHYSKIAIRDLDRVFSEVYEASQSLDLSKRYIDELLDKVEKKADFPKSGFPLYYENSFTGYYYLIYKAYLVFYRVEENSILVDRVLFGKSDYIRRLQLMSAPIE